MLKKYRWNGYTYKIADEDLHKYPGAIPVEAKKAPETKAAAEPKNKAAAAPKTKKSTTAKTKKGN